jgi:hypothetical protein
LSAFVQFVDVHMPTALPTHASVAALTTPVTHATHAADIACEHEFA